ncbi:MAG: hypothetical protein PHP54_02015 [Clostridia bacterium]|nr:hypothetical protein [Clostridia bacterium]
MIKRKSKIIVAILFLFLILFPLGTTTYAAINNEYNNGEVIETDLDGKLKNSVILDALAAMLYGLASLVESLVGSAFDMLTGFNMFPWADRVIFNTVPFLDVNFLNPAPDSLFLSKKDGQLEQTPLAKIVQSVYSTVFTLAVTFLGVVVGLMAIKLAISSLASEKAKYKEALMKFLFSLVMLFAMHYAMSFIFYINESMVEMASGILTENLGKATIDLDLDITKDTLVNNFIEQNHAGALSDVGVGLENLFSPLGGDASIYDKIKRMTSDELDAYIKDETIVKYVNDNNEEKGASNKQLAGYLLSNTAYRVFRIPDAYGNNTGSVSGWDVFKWFDLGTNVTEIDAKIKVALDIAKIQDVATYKHIKATSDDFKKIKFETFAISDQTVSPENVEKIKGTMYYNGVVANKQWNDHVGDFFEKMFNFMNGKLDDQKVTSIGKSAHQLSINYWDPMIRAHEIYVENSRAEDTTVDTLISNLGQYFKEAAWTYETNEEGEAKGWTPSKVTLTGAILYGMFIIQSLMFFFAYIKRFFYVVILAMLAPIIVIYDFLGKVAS